MQFLARSVLRPSQPRLLRAVVAGMIATAVCAPSAATASGSDVLSECLANKPISHHTAAEYDQAIKSMPADVAEYSPCADAISAARERDALAQGRRAHGLALAAGGAAGAAGLGSSGGSGGDGTPGAGGAAGLVSDGDAARTDAGAASDQATPSYDGAADPDFALAPVSGPAPGEFATGGSDHRWPAVPIVLALSVIALTGARGLQAWGQRSERLSPSAGGA
jgi:hypothetical protein